MGVAGGLVNPTAILTVNAGSTSLKLERYEFTRSPPALAVPLAPTHAGDALAPMLAVPVDAVAHRFVRVPDGSPAVWRLDDAARGGIAAVGADAPLHDAAALRAVDAIERIRPGIPQYAVADGAFHQTMSPAATTYAIPYAYARAGLRRLGYHGLSHEYAAHRGCALAGRDVAKSRVVTAHLGGGSSLCAVRDGESIDTTMGYTPLDGLPMATRSGSVDPGLLVHLLRSGMTVEALADMLERASGLLGISETTGDVRELLATRDAPGPRLALDVLAWRLRASLGAMVATLGGVDLIVFTGGIGEHAAEVRGNALAGGLGCAAWLDPARNGANVEGRIESGDSHVAVYVVRAREGWQLARIAYARMHEDR